MDYLKQPPKMPAYRCNRIHSDFLCKLEDFFPSKEDFIYRIQSTLQDTFLTKRITLEDIRPLLHGDYRKSTKYLNL